MSPVLRTYSPEQLAALLPWPEDDDNKYTRGKLVLVAGCAAYPGAACLAVRGASRVGAGYVQVHCAAQTAQVLRVWQPSAVAKPWENGLSLSSAPIAGRPVAYVLGPGFDVHDEACLAGVSEVLRFVAVTHAPLLVDGGALSIISARPDDLSALRAIGQSGTPVIITPHEREAVRLAAVAGIELSGDQPGAKASFTHRLAGNLHATVVLKGPDTYVASIDSDAVFAVTEGTSALAKAGTGDVLAGMIGGLLAQGVLPVDAAVLGATLHACAGQVAAERMTSICASPEDVLDAIPAAIRSMAR